LTAKTGNVAVNVGTGIDTSIAQLAEILIAAAGVDVTPIFNPRDVLVSRRAADTARAEAVLGFRPTIAVRDGMAALIRDGQ
jgi:UDP-glucose 4-epimerase